MTKKWKCKVCGYVYEGNMPPEICPLCGVGPDEFEEINTKDIKYMSDSKENILIIGNGIAGVSAAKAIRERNSDCDITIIASEAHLTYYRPELTGLISDEVNYDKLYVHKEEWYKDNNINLKLNTVVENIDTNNNCIVLNDGEKLPYDKLILANGSDSFIPPICGIDKRGVLKLRNLQDLKNIKEYIKENSCSKVTIIGSGLLGLEAAESFHSYGLKVTVLERASRILSKQLDEEASKLFEEMVDNYGINIIKEASAVEILGDSKVEAVKLSNGQIIDTDLVLVSVGITPNVQLVKDTNLKVNRGIIVNEKMETNIENIYACGDIAELKGRVFGIWAPSEEMGVTAGANVVGDNLVFEDFMLSTMLQAFDTQVFSCGDLKEDEKVATIIVKDNSKKIYKRLFFKDKKLVGCILLGEISDSIKLMDYIKQQKTLESIINNF